MVVCYHYQRGNCRYGAMCKFEHADPNYDSYYHPNDRSQFQGDRYHYIKPSAVPTQPAKIEASQIFDLVAADTIVAVKGSQWPFSSYGPVKGCQNIIGFDDISPEEMRYQMYIAKETGTVDDCKRHFNELFQMENMKRTLLMTPSVEADAAIQSIYRSDNQPVLANPATTGAFRTAGDSHSASIFGGSSLTTPFTASASAASIFGGNTTTPPTSNPFGVANSANIFGGGNVSNAFGSANTSSIFGGNSATGPPVGSVFGGAPTGLFSAAAAAVSQHSSGGFFGSTPVQPPTGQPQQPSGGFFGSSAVQQPSGLFAAAAANNSFFEPAVGSSSVFGGSSTTQPVFGASNHSASIFGAGKQTFAPSPTPAFGSTQGSNEPFTKLNLPPIQQGNEGIGSVYTPINDLDDEEKEAFQAKTFTIGKIPTRPPPRELCF